MPVKKPCPTFRTKKSFTQGAKNLLKFNWLHLIKSCVKHAAFYLTKFDCNVDHTGVFANKK